MKEFNAFILSALLIGVIALGNHTFAFGQSVNQQQINENVTQTISVIIPNDKTKTISSLIASNTSGSASQLNNDLLNTVKKVTESDRKKGEVVTQVIVNPRTGTLQTFKWNVGGDNKQSEKAFMEINNQMMSDLMKVKPNTSQNSTESHHPICLGLFGISIPHPHLEWRLVHFLWWDIWIPYFYWHAPPCR